jgi:hypothetical protein
MDKIGERHGGPGNLAGYQHGIIATGRQRRAARGGNLPGLGRNGFADEPHRGSAIRR